MCTILDELPDPVHDLVDPEMPGIPLVVALDGITDPRNLGAIVRSVAAFGGHGVVVPARRSVGMTASAWKTSAGAAARVADLLLLRKEGHSSRTLTGVEPGAAVFAGHGSVSTR